MKVRKLSLRCHCGVEPASIRQVGLTADQELVIHWQCPGCQMDVYVVKDLAGLRDLRKPQLPDQSKDADFLRSIGIASEG